MLEDTGLKILGKAYILSSLWIIENVDLIHPKWVAGAGFEPAAFRL
jgi:hypothetical protein